MLTLPICRIFSIFIKCCNGSASQNDANPGIFHSYLTFPHRLNRSSGHLLNKHDAFSISFAVAVFFRARNILFTDIHQIGHFRHPLAHSPKLPEQQLWAILIPSPSMCITMKNNDHIYFAGVCAAVSMRILAIVTPLPAFCVNFS